MARSIPFIECLPKELFSQRESAQVWAHVKTAAQRAGTSERQAFDDFLVLSLCALSGGAMEDQYLATVARYAKGPKGVRGCDALADGFSKLIAIMEDTRADILGDVFQGAITPGDQGQFFTPLSLCDLMAQLSLHDALHEPPLRVLDPCCGSGRMLLAAAKLRPTWEFVGQDSDVTCVRMTALNLALHNLRGLAIWGDSLTSERRSAYRTGFNGRGFIRELSADELAQVPIAPPPPAVTASVQTALAQTAGALRQLRLF